MEQERTQQQEWELQDQSFDFLKCAFDMLIWSHEKLQAACVQTHTYTDATTLRAKIEKHQALEAEVDANANQIVIIDNMGIEMIRQDHPKKLSIRRILDHLHMMWEGVRCRIAEEGRRLHQAERYLKSYIKHNYF